MSTALAMIPNNLPAFLQRQDLADAAKAFNASALGGIKVGGFPRVSIAGSKFFIIDSSAENPRQLITAVDPTGAVLPAMMLSAVVVGANPYLTKTYYEGEFVPGSEEEPDCSSDDGVVPDAHLANPVSAACATCPKNMWGSKITPQGKEVKACSDSKRLVILPSADLGFKALGLSISPASLKEWGAYARALSSKGIPVFAAVTRITFDITATFPKLNFAFERLLTQEEFVLVEQRMNSDEVKNIERPVRTERAPAALPAPVQQAPAAQPAPAQPAPAQPAPVPAAATFGTAPAPAPVQQAPVPAPLPVEPPPPADPLAGLPAETVAAINAMGGPTTPVGAQILAAARAVAGAGVSAPAPMPALDSAVAQAAQAAADNPPSPRSGRGRPRKNPDAAPAQPAPAQAPATTVGFGGAAPAPAPAPQPAAQPAPAATGFATSPAAVIVPAGSGVASDLDTLLSGVLGG